jgi:hypothetical protein
MICGNPSFLTGPATPPEGAVVVPPGDNHEFDFTGEGRIFWFAPGVHTLGGSNSGGIRPETRQRFIGGPNSVLDGQRRNMHAFGGDARDVEIRYLRIQNFGTGASNFNEGVVNHNSAEGWQVLNNEITHNDGAAVMLGTRNVVEENCLRDNGQYGFNAFDTGGLVDLLIKNNEIAYNNADDWEDRVDDCGCTGGGKIWDSTGVRVVGNWIHDNRAAGLWADTNTADVLIEHNWIEYNEGEGVIYEISQNATIRSNVFRWNNLSKGAQRYAEEENFPSAAIYLSGAAGDSRRLAAVSGAAQILVEGNLLENNWGGITAWEDSNRYCGSPANTSIGYCPKGSSASLETCVPELIAQEPYINDCRWRTSGVVVRDNDFKVRPEWVPECEEKTVWIEDEGLPVHPCATMGIISNEGTSPSWSPYLGSGIQDSIVFHQSNLWLENRYVGPWSFSVREPGTYVTFDVWRSRTFGQDRFSSFQRG